MREIASDKSKRSLKRARCAATAEQQALTVPQAAKIIGKTERALWLDIYRKRFPHRRQGRKIIILRDELETFLRALDGVTVQEALEHVEAGGGR